MAVSLLTRELEWWDPIFFGLSPRAVAAGVDAGFGLGGWCNPSGVHLLYQGTPEATNIDYTRPVGASSPTSASPGEIRTFPWVAFEPETVYWHNARAVGRGGAEEASGSVPVPLTTDADGIPLPLVPNPPVWLTLSPRAGGKFLLEWSYVSRGQQATPARYRIYHDNGTGTIDYVTPIATVTGLRWQSGAYADGTTVKFVVRAATRAGLEEKNTNTVTGIADSGGPADMGQPTITEGAET